jgi:hypothetical protein
MRIVERDEGISWKKQVSISCQSFDYRERLIYISRRVHEDPGDHKAAQEKDTTSGATTTV